MPVCQEHIGELVKVVEVRPRLRVVLYELSIEYMESYSRITTQVRGIIQMLSLVNPVAIARALVRDKLHQAEVQRKG